MTKTLTQDMIDAGVKPEHIEGREGTSDMYVLVTPEAKAFIEGHECKHMTTTFRSQIDNALWFDIPFGRLSEMIAEKEAKRNPFQVVCKGCNKTPNEIMEYVSGGRREKCSPVQYVRDNEGTFNPVTGRFYCDTCYIKAGMPLGKA